MKPVYWIIGALVLVGLFFLSACESTIERIEPTASAVVLISDTNGHGSGVHIGNGYIITAAHVASIAPKFTIKNDKGEEQEGEVLWTDAKRDVALIRVAKPELLGTSELSCRDPEVGEHITVKGNPGPFEALSFGGAVVGEGKTYAEWERAVVVDITLAPGISGGPVYDDDGKVVGIAIGALLIPTGTVAGAIPISLIVPGTAICALMPGVV